MNNIDEEINMDDIRESFAIQGTLVMNQLELLMAETERLLIQLTQNPTVVQDGLSNKTQPSHKIDVYRASTSTSDAPLKKRRKIE